MRNEIYPTLTFHRTLTGWKPIQHRVPTLHGRGNNNDSEAIRTLLRGGCAFDARNDGALISAPTISALPAGLYSLIHTNNPYQPPKGRK